MLLVTYAVLWILAGSDVTDSAVFFDIGGVFFVEYSADLARTGLSADAIWGFPEFGGAVWGIRVVRSILFLDLSRRHLFWEAAICELL